MKFLKSFGYAFAGLRVALSSQLNLKIHFLAFAVVVALGFFFGIDRMEWCVLLLISALVISLELINTAIEELVTFISPERHNVAGMIKDIAAAAVLFASGLAIIIGFIIFAKYL